MTIFDWPFLLPTFLTENHWGSPTPRASHDLGICSWEALAIGIKKMYKNTEVVYKYLYIEEIYKDNSYIPTLYHMFIQFNLKNSF